jgi:hypothetical protein
VSRRRSAADQLRGAGQLFTDSPRPCSRPLRLGAIRQDRRSSVALPKDVRNDPQFAYSDDTHGELRSVIAAELHVLIEQPY